MTHALAVAVRNTKTATGQYNKLQRAVCTFFVRTAFYMVSPSAIVYNERIAILTTWRN